MLHALEVLEARRIADMARDARKVRDRLLEKVADADLGEPQPHQLGRTGDWAVVYFH